MGFSLQALLLAVTATQALASCAHGTFLSPRAEDGTVKVNKFGYTGLNGPLNWASLESPANIGCATGTHQSPIDMIDGQFTLMKSSDIQLSIPDIPEGAEFENLGTTVEVIAKGGTLKVDNKDFELQQFHFHLPSEHLDNGTSQAMEMHMVFQSTQQEVAVIGVYINIAPPSTTNNNNNANANNSTLTPTPFLESIFSTITSITTPGTKTTTPALPLSSTLQTLLTAQSNTFQSYSGSLTTPPCTEGVRWFVSAARMAIAPETFLKVRDVIGFNSRFPQNKLGEPNILMISSLGASKAAVEAMAMGNAQGVVAVAPAPVMVPMGEGGGNGAGRTTVTTTTTMETSAPVVAGTGTGGGMMKVTPARRRAY
ncbi:alpha carbonic anhydrase [Dichotomopilus funicola]|uniref:carbonic anhydrase n=1 Tax=Dichotomopilus funicola TaxID=1934379 RepID=A0AAN6V9M8_9PEZI|nr:alpha carbonic anhydrase [Dichotomopilus funicola]